MKLKILSISGLLPRLMLMLLLLGAASIIKPAVSAGVAPKMMNCDPCIRRSEYRIQAIVHGTKNDIFWQSVQAAMIQAGRDMGIQFEMELYDKFDPVIMAADILGVAKSGLADALLITIPSAEVHDAIRFAVDSGLPVFGFNSGYEAAADLGLLGFVAQHEYLAGEKAAEELIKISGSTSTGPSRAVFINHQKGNVALDERFRGFNETLSLYSNNTATIEELVVDISDLLAMNETIDTIFGGACSRYNTILAGGAATASFVLKAAERNGCISTTSNSGGQFINGDSPTIATFDEDADLHRSIIQGKLAFAMSQQKYLQGVLPVVMGSIYATTKKKLALPLDNNGIYLSGPVIINKANVPSDSHALCEAEAFPTCSATPIWRQRTQCPCFERGEIRLAGVLHGVTTDKFWDPVFSVAHQTAKDLGVQLSLDRLQPETNNTVLYQKMASRIKTECESGVHGIFVTIPSSQAVQDAVKTCLLLNVPVIGVNSAPKLSEELGVMQHIGQDDYSAGYEAGKRLIAAGMTEGYCINHEEGNSGMTARCNGLADAIADHTSSAVDYGGTVIVPHDLEAEFQIKVEDAIAKSGSWEGIGFLLTGGIVQLRPALSVKSAHPNLLLGTFDVNELMYPMLEDGSLLFTFDQQPYLQGNLPVYLLTYTAYTRQRLLNAIVQTGPNAILSPPTEEERTCEANHYQTCSILPEENFNHISPGWLGFGYASVAAIGVVGISCLLWMYFHRENSIVTAGQPPFLVLLVLGSVLSSLAIIPMGIETGYRTVKDPLTGVFTDAVSNPYIDQVDAACMAWPWLYGVGFVLMFSALLSKIFRVQMIYKAGRKMIRRRVGYRHVMFILVIMLTIEVSLLLSWQLVSPLRWEREVTLENSKGYALESVGSCTSDAGWYFMAAIVGLHIACLFYALMLCWQAKHIPTEYAESNWVSLSVIFIFQVSVLVIPIASMVREETDVFYFVRVCALFLQSFTVLLFIFAPKMYKVSQGQGGRSTSNRASSSSTIVHRFTASSKDAQPLELSSNEGQFSKCCEAEITTVCSCCGANVIPEKRSKRTLRDTSVSSRIKASEEDHSTPFSVNSGG